jgi:hypothetical protein
MSVERSALVVGLSMALIDGNGCPLLRPEAVSASYTVTDQNSLAGIPLGKCSLYLFAPKRKLPSASVKAKGYFAPPQLCSRPCQG